MDIKNRSIGAIVCLFLAWWCAPVHAGKLELPDGSHLDLAAVCPVCNMKPTSNPLGPAAVVFKDGRVVGFDGARHLFIYVLDTKTYACDLSKVSGLFVTVYGTKDFIDAKQAFFVMESDVKGNMGSEVVPFATRKTAEKFKTDHNGKRVATFGEVTLDDVREKKGKLRMHH